jgi:cell wall-associated NlpC family hydrolase
LVVGLVVVGLRHPAARGERMMLLAPSPAAVIGPATGVKPVAPAANPAAFDAATPRRMGRWTSGVGTRIAQRAAQWLGWPYSFGAGNAEGPTYGHAVDADSRDDGSVLGFDCSGLTLYALAPWRALPHDAAAQYHAAGSFHPSLDQLAPGDLIFWSADGTVQGIGHVAVYIGNGQVVQAPRSGLDVTVSPLYGVERAYMGATRPLS